MKLYRGNTEVIDLVIDDSTTITNKLMMENTMRLSATCSVPVDFRICDHVEVDGERYELYDVPEVTLDGSTYKYDALFVGNLHRLDSWLLDDSADEEFYYFGTLNEHLRLITTAICSKDNGWTYTLNAADIDASPKNIEYGSVSCLSALHKVAEEFDIEFNVALKAITVAHRIERVSSFEFAIGKGEGLYSITRGKVSNDKITTRMYGLGATTNMKDAKRLTFDEKYIERNVALYGLREDKVTFDNIFPRHTGSLTSDAVQIEAGKILWQVVDTKMDFDLKKQFLEEPKIGFTTGGCAGLEFVITDYDHATKTITFKEYASDDYVVPNVNRKPLALDEYHYINIIMPDVYVTNAKKELKAATENEIARVCVPTAPYTIDVDPRFVKAAGARPMNGDLVRITNDDIGLDALIRVIAFTYPVINPNNIELTVCDNILISGSASLLREVRKEIASSFSSSTKFHPLTGSKYLPIKASRSTSSEVEVLDSLFSEDFNPALTGFAFTRDEWGRWLLEVDRIVARESLTVPEFVKNRITVANNQTWFTDNGIIDTVEEVEREANQRIVTIAAERGGGSTFKLDDLLKGLYAEEVGSGLEFRTVRMTVLEVITPYTLRVSVDENTPPPREELIVVRTGNRTNPDRQNSIFMDGARPAMFYYVNVDSHLITERNIAQATGNLKGYNFGKLTGNRAITERFSSIMRGDNYISGHLVQMSGNGLEYPLPAERGAWMSGVTYYHYDRVSHGGSLWDCAVTQTTAEPTTAATDWTERVAKGGDGVNGKDGKDGLSVAWQGDLSNQPSNPQKNWAYRNTDNGVVYIYNGTAWVLMVADGSDGADGAKGSDGNSVFITYHDNATTSKPTKPTGNGAADGWHTTPSSSCVWMSQKVASTATAGSWGEPMQIQGEGIGSLEIGGANLILDSKVVTVGAWVGSGANRLVKLVKGRQYTLSYDSTDMVVANDFPQFYIWSDSWEKPMMGLGTITSRERTFVFTLESGEYYLSVYNHNYPTGGVFNKLKLERGNKATDWSPAPEDLNRAVMYQGEFKDGKVYYNNLSRQDVVKLKNSSAWYRYIGANGRTASAPPSATHWESFGASFESIATGTLLAENANLAGFVFRNDELCSQETIDGNVDPRPKIKINGKTGDAEFHNVTMRGKVEAISGKIGNMYIDRYGELMMKDDAGNPIILLSKTDIIPLSQMLVGNEDITTPMPALSLRTTTTEQTATSGWHQVSNAGATLTVRGSLDITVESSNPSTDGAWVNVSVELVNASGSLAYLGQVSCGGGALSEGGDGRKRFDFSTVVNAASVGHYYVRIGYRHVIAGNGSSTVTLNQGSFRSVKTSASNQSYLGRGLAVIMDANNHLHYGRDANGTPLLTYKGKTDMPGVFVAGTAYSFGGVMNSWGKNGISVSRRSVGVYEIIHNIGHTNYFITANAQYATPPRICTWYNKGTNSVYIRTSDGWDVLTDNNFDFQITGQN